MGVISDQELQLDRKQLEIEKLKAKLLTKSPSYTITRRSTHPSNVHLRPPASWHPVEYKKEPEDKPHIVPKAPYRSTASARAVSIELPPSVQAEHCQLDIDQLTVVDEDFLIGTSHVDEPSPYDFVKSVQDTYDHDNKENFQEQLTPSFSSITSIKSYHSKTERLSLRNEDDVDAVIKAPFHLDWIGR